MKYLREEQYYIDLYDQGTIEQCQRMANHFNPPLSKNADEKEKTKQLWSKTIGEVALHCLKGERFSVKSETIREWMNRDQQRDELFENTQPIPNVRCLKCGSIMEVLDKSLDLGLEKKDDRVLFTYHCTKCKGARFFYGDGKEHIPEKPRCPECKTGLLKSNYKEDKGQTVFTMYCESCGHKDEDIFSKSKIEKPDYDFETERQKYCMNDKEGSDFMSMKFGLERLNFLQKEEQGKKEVAKRIGHIKKLNITELEEALSNELEKSDYAKLEISNPEISKDIIVSFTVRDEQKGRSEYDSEHQLKKAIEKILKDTNWHLMSDGVSYRLGILSGRVKGYDRDEDIYKDLNGTDH